MFSLVIPAYNEEKRLIQTLDKIKAGTGRVFKTWSNFEIIIVCDGCSDNTENLARNYTIDGVQVKTIAYAVNRGKGHAIKTGILATQGSVIGFMDADSASDIKDVLRLAEMIEANEADVIAGSRHADDSLLKVKQPLLRRIAGTTFRKTVKTILNVPVNDTQCGLKVFKGDAGRFIFQKCEEDGFIIDVEILLLASLCHYQIKEVGINWQHQGDTKINLLSDSLKMFFALCRLAWKHRTRPTGHHYARKLAAGDDKYHEI